MTAKKQPTTLDERIAQQRKDLATAQAELAGVEAAPLPDQDVAAEIRATIAKLEGRIAADERRAALLRSEDYRQRRLADLAAGRQRTGPRHDRMAKIVTDVFGHVQSCGPLLAELAALQGDNAADYRSLTADAGRLYQDTRHLATLEKLGPALADAVYVSGLGRIALPAFGHLEITRPAINARPIEQLIAEHKAKLDQLLAAAMARHEQTLAAGWE